ncbi:MAG: SDR family NAD(P)-dependent oxidoreductase [Candidatus Obscuribacterales bacterium]|nr:SDR family NAD(P)-dependent oxidoreductase [Candidatus Obscuribacterales bacterium]
MEIADFGIMALHPFIGIDTVENPSIAIAASRAGGIGIFDVEFLEKVAAAAGIANILSRAGGGRVGIRCGIQQIETFSDSIEQLGRGPKRRNIVVLCAGTTSFTREELTRAVSFLHLHNLDVFCEVVSVAEAQLAESAGADSVIVKGNDSAGRVGEETGAILLQRCSHLIGCPLWLQGGVGLHSAAAAYAGGARGVVLDSQLWLTRESPLGPVDRDLFGRMDGTETVCLPCGNREQYRVRLKTGSAYAIALQQRVEQMVANSTSVMPGETNQVFKTIGDAIKSTWQETGAAMPVLPLGQDSAFASTFARQYASVAAVISAIRNSVEESCRLAGELKPFAEGAPLAVSNNTRYPLLQGAMTRVSDTSEFADAVASNGGLPFLALALMRGSEVEALMRSTAEKLAGKSWGVGMLGFVPHQLRQEQTAVIEKIRPPFALIAGGRPDQAAELEKCGIRTYLHVPSPLLLESFIESGSRRFIFEGRECGGHVGPRSSFVLWEQMIDVVVNAVKKTNDAASFEIVFAGGIHDDLSAAMTAALAAPLAKLGVKLGLLMGTAYLFTEEAVSTGAICNTFQDAALKCTETVLLETGPGHAIRCLESPYKNTFDETRRKLEEEGRGKNEVRQELELMNLGRLRTASKGVARAESGSGLVPVPEEKQWNDGMYMIGQVAAMHDKRTTIGALHQTVCSGSSSLLEKFTVKEAPQVVVGDSGGEAIAIVGMSCMFPKANDLESFWENILNKVDTIEEVPAYQWDVNKLYDKNPFARDKIASKWGGFLQDIPFDPSLYGIPPSSLASIDPMQLMILEVTRGAIADAGYDVRAFDRERTSVILANAGHGPITAFYSLRSMLDWTLADMPADYRRVIEQRLPEWTEDSFPGYLGNVVAGRVANRFDLGGVNYCVDAACGSSLAALHSAVRELRAGTSDYVLLASTDTHNQPGDYLSFSKTHALSPRGRCRTFDASADGIVISEGLAVLMLKRLSDAERDGDRIYAVIKGVGGSSDGRDLSLTAPRPGGQMLALKRAYSDAGVSPDSVELVEAHGTGTVAGDKAEVEALTTVFGAAGAQNRSCAIGSVKTMIGHTKCSAGLASMIKVAKSLYHKVLPPTLGVETPNPSCKFDSSPFYINTEPRPWVHSVASNSPRRAGISAFGFGGTNFHAVLEEYTGVPLRRQESAFMQFPCELFVLRAPSREILLKYVAALSTAAVSAQKTNTRPHGPVADANRVSLAELAYRTFIKNQASSQKGQIVVSIVATSLADLQAKLEQVRAVVADSGKDSMKDPRGVYFSATERESRPKVAFLFPGQGSQQINMLRDLSLVFKDVRETFEKADHNLSDRLTRRLSDYVFPPSGFTDEKRAEQQHDLTETSIAQPAVAAAGLASWRLLSSFGIKPDALAGHSFGEYIALAASGSLSERDVLRIAERRGSILSRANQDCSGTMAAVAASADQLQKLMHEMPGITLANINSPSQCIISGEAKAVKNAITRLAQHGLKARPIAVSAAFHSPLMEPVKADLFAELTLVDFGAAKTPVYSNTTTETYPEDTEEFAALLARHLVEPVRFQDEIERMHSDGIEVFIECGPGSVLTGLVNDILTDRPHLTVSIDRHGRHGVLQLLHTLATLASAGIELDLQRLYAHRFDGRSINQDTTGGALHKKRLHFMVNSAQIRRFDPETGHVHPGPVRFPTDQEVSARKHMDVLPTSERSADNSALPQVRPAQTASTSTNSDSGLQTAPVSTLPAASTPSAGGTRNTNPPAPTVTNRPAKTPVTRPPADARATSAATGRDRMMIEFQSSLLEMTNNFLQTQERVMMAYLGANEANSVAPARVMQSQVPRIASPDLSPAPEQPTLSTGLQPAQNRPQAVPAPARSLVTPPGYTGNGNGNGNGSHRESLSTRELHQQIATTATGPVAEPALDPEFLINSLINIVSERTGYPSEMLDPALDLEADLGIDSIKRVEILNNFRKLLPDARQQSLESGIEKLAATKTLQGIMDWIRTDLVKNTPDPENSSSSGSTPAVKVPETSTQKRTSYVARGIAKLHPLPWLTERINSGRCLIVSRSNEQLESITTKFTSAGVQVVTILDEAAGTKPSDKSVTVLDLTNLGAVSDAISTLSKDAPVNHVLYIAENEDHTDVAQAKRSVLGLFVVSKALHSVMPPDQRWNFIAATAGEGSFGLESGMTRPVLGGIAGIMKTTAREWPLVKSRAIEFATDIAMERRADWLLKEFAAKDDRTEISYTLDVRSGIEVIPSALNTGEHAGENGNGADLRKLNLDRSSVVLVTGGARGITCDLAYALAVDYKPTIVIAGRGERPKNPEPAWAANLSTASDLKAAIMADLRATGKAISVPAVEAVYRSLLKEREMRSNLERLEKSGATIHYYALDVRKESDFAALIDRIYDMFGRIDAVIHGAGIIEDAYIKDKSPESFERVFSTKVDSALVLSRKLQLDSLKYLILLSSVVGRTGNAGQADYVAANEVLNKLAGNLQRESAARVVSIGWGPWRGGMARPELEAIFATYGWALIEVEDGVRHFREELAYGSKENVEVLLVGKPATETPPDVPKNLNGAGKSIDENGNGNGTGHTLGSEKVIRSLVKAATVKGEALTGARLHGATIIERSSSVMETRISLDPRIDAYLNDHTFDGMPVLPMAVANELFAEAGSNFKAGYSATVINKLEIPAGVVFENGAKDFVLRVTAEKETKDGIEVSMTLAAGSNKKRINFKCGALLTQAGQQAIKHPILPAKFNLMTPEQALAEMPSFEFIYRNWMFHGPLFQGIDSVDAFGLNMIIGTVTTSKLSDCIKIPNVEPWTLDPIMLDSVMQLAGVWARQYLGITALPTGFKKLTRVAPSVGDTYRAIVAIPAELVNELNCDLAIYDDVTGNMVLLMEGLNGVGNKNLNRLSAGQNQKRLRSSRR